MGNLKTWKKLSAFLLALVLGLGVLPMSNLMQAKPVEVKASEGETTIADRAYVYLWMCSDNGCIIGYEADYAVIETTVYIPFNDAYTRQWYSTSASFKSDKIGGVEWTIDEDSWKPISGETGSRILVRPEKEPIAVKYVATFSDGSVKESDYEIIRPSAGLQKKEPTYSKAEYYEKGSKNPITMEFITSSIVEGHEVSYTWSKAVYDETTGDGEWIPIKGANSKSYTVTDYENNDDFLCFASNDLGDEVFCEYTLVERQPSVSVTAKEYNIIPTGGKVDLQGQIELYDSELISCSWYKYGAKIETTKDGVASVSEPGSYVFYATAGNAGSLYTSSTYVEVVEEEAFAPLEAGKKYETERLKPEYFVYTAEKTGNFVIYASNSKAADPGNDDFGEYCGYNNVQVYDGKSGKLIATSSPYGLQMCTLQKGEKYYIELNPGYTDVIINFVPIELTKDQVVDTKADVAEGAPATEIAMKQEEVFDAILTEEEKAAVASGAEVAVKVSVDTMKAEDLSKEETAKVTEQLTAITKNLNEQIAAGTIKAAGDVKAEDIKVAAYLDIDLNVLIGDKARAVTETGKPVQIAVDAPKDMPAVAKGSERTYIVLRLHEGTVTALPATLKDGKIVFESDQFSTYILTYVDVVTEKDTATGDNNMAGLYIWFMFVALAAGAFVAIRVIDRKRA